MKIVEVDKPLYYVRQRAVFCHPVRTEKGVRLGFRVCEVCDCVDPADVADLLNKGEQYDAMVARCNLSNRSEA